MVLAFCLSVCVIVSENERRKFFVGSVLGSPRLLRRRKFIFEVFRKPQRDNFSSCYSQLSVMSEKEKNNGSQCIQILWLIFFFAESLITLIIVKVLQNILITRLYSTMRLLWCENLLLWNLSKSEISTCFCFS